MNDPRLTAYALGELTGPERDTFERDLAASPTLQAQLNETIQLADTLGSLTMPSLLQESRTELLAQCAANQRTRQRNKIIRLVAISTGTLAAAACVLVSLSLPAISGSLVKPTNLATNEMPTEAIESRMAGYVIPHGGKTKTDPILAQTSEREAKLSEEIQRQLASAPATASLAPSGPLNISGSTVSAIPPVLTPAPSRDGLLATTEAVSQIRSFTAGWGKGPETERRSELGGTSTRTDFNTETYDSITENTFLAASDNPLSTFSIDVDTASYANVRRFLQNDQLPPVGAIRTEEFINYFTYAYPQPTGDTPFSVNLEVSRAPWDSSRELVRIGLKGRELQADKRIASNLVFLIDVSGSMEGADKLPLLKQSLQALVKNLSPKDRVALVVYAGSSGLVLPPTPGSEKAAILAALDNLQAGGSTNGASGIQLAYDTARQHFLKEGNNRVILCTDGDFNVGTTDQSELVRLIEKERASGVFLSVLGFGTGNLKDSTMEKLADKGNGNYAYIDSLTEGRKVLVEQMASTLFTIAKDVKVQVEFNPARVAGYRLLGYENRLLAKEDFNDDKKDAGEIGAGHTVTALYEIIPAGQPLPGQPSVDPLKYQTPAPVTGATTPTSTDLLTVKLRYKAPDSDQSKLLEFPLRANDIPTFANATPDFQFATAVATFALKLRNSPTTGDLTWDDIKKIARTNLGEDPGSYRAEFLTLIERAARLQPNASTPAE